MGTVAPPQAQPSRSPSLPSKDGMRGLAPGRAETDLPRPAPSKQLSPVSNKGPKGEAAPAGAKRKLEDLGSAASPSASGPAALLESDVRVDVVCQEPAEHGAAPATYMEGVFHARTGKVLCNCMECKGSVEFMVSRWVGHAGASQPWKACVTVKSSGTPLSLWIQAEGAETPSRSTPKKRWKQALPPGWTTEHHQSAAPGRKAIVLFKGSCATCGKSRSVETKDQMERFLSKHSHNSDWAGLSPNGFPWHLIGVAAEKGSSSSGCSKAQDPKGEPAAEAAAGLQEQDEKPIKASGDASAPPADGKAEPACKQCGATTTPQWRNGKTMCNACYMRERKEKMLGKRRATAPAGYQVPFVLDSTGLPIALPQTQTGQQQKAPSAGKSLGVGQQRRSTLGRPTPRSPPGGSLNSWPMGGSANMQSAEGAFRQLAANMAQRGGPHSYRHEGSQPPPGFFPAGMFAHQAPMHSPLAGMLPKGSGGQAGASHLAALAAAQGAMQGHMQNSPSNLKPGSSSPEQKPTFSPEESVLRQMSLMDSDVAETLAVCAASYAEERCAARDKGYETGTRAMKSRVSKMLVEGDGPAGATDADLSRRLEQEVEAAAREREAVLLQSITKCCKSIVERWRASQVASVRAACEDGQRMAREDFTKHLYECLRNN